MLNGTSDRFFFELTVSIARRTAQDAARQSFLVFWRFARVCGIKGCSTSAGIKKQHSVMCMTMGLLSAVGALLWRLWCLSLSMLLSEDIGSDLQLRGILHILVKSFTWQLSVTEIGLIFQSISHCIHFHFDFIWHLHVVCEHQTLSKHEY